MNFIHCALLVNLFTLKLITLSTAKLTACRNRTLWVRVSENCNKSFNEFKELCYETLKDAGYKIESFTCNGTHNNKFTSKFNFAQKHDTAIKSFESFKMILERTVVDVLILEANRKSCMESYKKWLCFTQYEFYNNSSYNDSATTICSKPRCKPSIQVCNKVVQNCPYYAPSRHQCHDDVDGECSHKRVVIYGGLPAFMCPKKNNQDYVYEENDDGLYCDDDT